MRRTQPAFLPPWSAPIPTKAQVLAAQAVQAGTANEGQQQIFWDYLVKSLCGIGALSFQPGMTGDRDTAFAEGKKFIALELVRLATMRGPDIEKLENRPT